MLHHPEVVGDKQKRDAAVVAQVGKQIDDLRLNRHIKGRDGFIGDDKIRVEDQRPGNTDPLTLAAGELMREAGIVFRRRRRSSSRRSPGHIAHCGRTVCAAAWLRQSRRQYAAAGSASYRSETPAASSGRIAQGRRGQVGQLLTVKFHAAGALLVQVSRVRPTVVLPLRRTRPPAKNGARTEAAADAVHRVSSPVC